MVPKPFAFFNLKSVPILFFLSHFILFSQLSLSSLPYLDLDPAASIRVFVVIRTLSNEFYLEKNDVAF